VERAKEARIRPLILTGLTKDGLASDVLAAIQHKICLLPEVLAFKIRNDLSHNQSTSFFDEAGVFCGNTYDLIWQRWIEGTPPSLLGEHTIDLSIPPNWRYRGSEVIQPDVSFPPKFKSLVS
jgi:hypothetical protein